MVIGTTTVLAGFPVVALAQDRPETLQEIVTQDQEERLAENPIFSVDSAKYREVSAKDAKADSEQTTQENGGTAAHAIDGNASTVWHSDYNNKTMPHWISYSLDEVTTIGRIDYLGKPGQNGVGNGVFKDISIYYTQDAGADPSKEEGWTLAKTFSEITYNPSTGTDTNRAATFEFDPVDALKVKIVVTGSYSSGSGTEPENQYANALELKTYAVTPEDKLDIQLTIDNQEYTGASIQEIVEKNNITPKKVKSLTITGGHVEYSDLEYLGAVVNHSNFKFEKLKKLTVDLTKATMYTVS